MEVIKILLILGFGVMMLIGAGRGADQSVEWHRTTGWVGSGLGRNTYFVWYTLGGMFFIAAGVYGLLKLSFG